MNRSFPKTSFVAALLLVGLLLSPRPVNAQETPPPPPALDPEEAAELASRVAAQVISMADTNAPAMSNDFAPTGEPLSQSLPGQNPRAVTPEGQNRESLAADSNRSGDRRSSSRRFGRDYSNTTRSSRGEERPGEQSSNSGQHPANAQPAANRPDFSSFRIIAERNIFDPNRRSSRSSTPRERPKTVDSFSLVGVMSYEKGSFAFFDGTSSTYRKALKENDTIAGYRVTGINSRAVQLASGTNQLELQVGMGLRREDQGDWTRSGRHESSSSSSSSVSSPTPTTPTSQTDTAANGGESDVLKRLRERREKE